MVDPNTGLPDFITESRNKAQSASDAATDFQSAALTIPDQLKKIVTETMTKNKDIIEGRSQTLSNYLSSPATAEARFGQETLADGTKNANYVFNPFQRNQVISDFVSANEVPFMTYNSLLGLTMGDSERFINAASNAMQAQSTVAQRAADKARQTYEDTLSEFKVGREDARAEAKLPLEMQLLQAQASNALRGTQADQQANYLAQLKADVASGADLDTVMKKYSDKLGPEDIFRLYNTNSPNGPSKESSSMLQTKYGVVPTKTQQKLEESQQTVQGAVNALGSLKSNKPVWYDVGGLAKYYTQKAIVGQQVARLYEKGVLSDKDRDFYQNKIPGPFDPMYDAKMAGLESGLSVAAGYSKPKLQLQDGSIAEYDSLMDPDYISDLNAGGIRMF